MRIAVNAQLLTTQENYRGAGVSNYSLRLLRAMAQTQRDGDSRHQITAFVHDPAVTLDGIELMRSTLPLGNPLARIAWEQSALPLLLRRAGAELVHGLVNVLPLATNVPGIVTVHDLSFVRTPEMLPPVKRRYLAALCRASCRRARRIIAVSRQTADDLIELFELPARAIEVIHNGVGQEFTPTPAALSTPARPPGPPRPDRYFLYVGTLEPRKNLELLVRAYARWRAQHRGAPIALVLAGGQGWYYDEIFATVTQLGLADQVIFPGFVPAADLPGWYRGAVAFVYPSRFEGFGLPVVEAMACGTPVICSTIPSLQEVAGAAALTFAPEDEETLVAHLETVATDAAARTDLRGRGLIQARRFSWHNTAAATLALYDDLLA